MSAIGKSSYMTSNVRWTAGAACECIDVLSAEQAALNARRLAEKNERAEIDRHGEWQREDSVPQLLRLKRDLG